MRTCFRPRPPPVFRVLLGAGTLLAVTMPTQTVLGCYITGNLLLQQGRREGERQCRSLEEGRRTFGASGAALCRRRATVFSAGCPPEAAWIVVVNEQNQVLAARGRASRLSLALRDRTWKFRALFSV